MRSKTLIASLLAVGLLSALTSCKKDDPEEEETTTPATTMLDPCNGDDGFCMMFGATEKSGAAKLTDLTNSSWDKVRIYWEKGSGTEFEQVELDIYATGPGTYNVTDLFTTDAAFMQYYSQAGGTVNAAYGTVTVTELDIDGNTSGTFNITMKDSTKVTNGIFRNIVKE